MSVCVVCMCVWGVGVCMLCLCVFVRGGVHAMCVLCVCVVRVCVGGVWCVVCVVCVCVGGCAGEDPGFREGGFLLLLEERRLWLEERR